LITGNQNSHEKGRFNERGRCIPFPEQQTWTASKGNDKLPPPTKLCQKSLNENFKGKTLKTKFEPSSF